MHILHFDCSAYAYTNVVGDIYPARDFSVGCVVIIICMRDITTGRYSLSRMVIPGDEAQKEWLVSFIVIVTFSLLPHRIRASFTIESGSTQERLSLLRDVRPDAIVVNGRRIS